MLADERTVRLILERDGPDQAGRAWAEQTASVIQKAWRARLPSAFPGLLVDAERIAANARLGDGAAGALYACATATWQRLTQSDETPDT